MRRTKHIPIRSCVVCRRTSDKRMLLRVVRQPEKSGGNVVVDEVGRLSGRGAYVCATDKCIGLAQKQKRFERALAVTADRLSPELFEKLLSLSVVEVDKQPESAETYQGSEMLRGL